GTPERGQDMPAHLAEYPGVVQYLRADPATLADEGEEEMFRAHDAIATTLRLIQGQSQDLAGTPHIVPVGGGWRVAPPDYPAGHRPCVKLADRRPCVGKGQPEGGEGLGRESLFLPQQPEEQVFGADEGVVEACRFLLRHGQNAAGARIEPTEMLTGNPHRLVVPHRGEEHVRHQAGDGAAFRVGHLRQSLMDSLRYLEAAAVFTRWHACLLSRQK